MKGHPPHRLPERLLLLAELLFDVFFRNAYSRSLILVLRCVNKTRNFTIIGGLERVGNFFRKAVGIPGRAHKAPQLHQIRWEGCSEATMGFKLPISIGDRGSILSNEGPSCTDGCQSE